jgi:hypothetical protein
MIMGVTLLKRKGCAKIERQVNIYFTDLCNSYNKIWMDIDRAKVGKSPNDYRQCIELYGSAIAKIDKSKKLIKALQEAIDSMDKYIKQYDAIYNNENAEEYVPPFDLYLLYKKNVETLNYMKLMKDEVNSMLYDFELVKEVCWNGFDDFTRDTLTKCVRSVRNMEGMDE